MRSAYRCPRRAEQEECVTPRDISDNYLGIPGHALCHLVHRGGSAGRAGGLIPDESDPLLLFKEQHRIVKRPRDCPPLWISGQRKR
jgi:hypothetical protein